MTPTLTAIRSLRSGRYRQWTMTIPSIWLIRHSTISIARRAASRLGRVGIGSWAGRFGNAEQAVEISNKVPFGLVTSVFTRDLTSALTVVDGLETGMIRINQPTSGVDFHAPFGGEKQSSFGPREQGKAARELYTSTHTITIGPG